MLKSFIKFLLIGIGASVFLLIFAIPAKSFALTVGPAKMEFSVDPGDVITGKLFLLNDESETKVLYPTFEKFIEVDGEKRFLAGEPTELTNWFKINAPITLKPGESKDVPFEIDFPKNAPPGGHFAVIWWSSAPPSATGKTGGGASIVTRAGILVYSRVSGDIKEDAEILNFDTAEKGRFFSWMPEKFTVSFENKGNVYLKPKGEITIKNIFGSTKAGFLVNKEDLQILPQSKKDLRIASQTMKWGGFGLGLYKAELNLIYGEGNKKIESGFWFAVITWQIVLPIILGLHIVFFGATKGIKKYNQWVVSKYTGLR